MRSYAAWKEEYDGSHDAPIDEESMWANLAHFLQAVVPVAEEAGVRLALHPEDPPVLESLGQAAHITSTLDQYERVFALAPGRANAMTFWYRCHLRLHRRVCRSWPHAWRVQPRLRHGDG